MPAPDGGDDFVWVLGPDEGLRTLVVFGQEAIDGGLEVDKTFEDAAFEAPLGQDGEEAFDGIEPGSRCRREVEDEPRMPRQPLSDLGMLVSRVIVEDHVDDFTGRNLGLDQIKEADELLVPVTLSLINRLRMPDRLANLTQ